MTTTPTPDPTALGPEYQRAADMTGVYAKVAVMGAFGAGKTHTVALLGDDDHPVAVLLTEANGAPTIRRANPHALVRLATTMDGVRGFLRDAMSGRLRAAGYGRLAVDGFTEVQRLMKDEIQRRARDRSARDEDGKKRPAAEDDLMDFNERDWGELGERGLRFLRLVRDLPYDVALTVGANVELVDGVRYVTPLLQGKMTGKSFGGFFNAVGYLFRREVAGEDGTDPAVVRRVLFEGPSNYSVKWCAPLGRTELPDAADWVARIKADLGAARGAAPDVPAARREDAPPAGAKPRRRRRFAAASQDAPASGADHDPAGVAAAMSEPDDSAGTGAPGQ